MAVILDGVEAPVPVYQAIEKTITFDGSAGGGAVGTVTVFTVSGTVGLLSLVPVITVDIASGGSATAALGLVGSTTYVVAATAKAQLTAAKRFWLSTTCATPLYYQASRKFPVAINANVIITVGTADITSGSITFKAVWEPFSAGATLT